MKIKSLINVNKNDIHKLKKDFLNYGYDESNFTYYVVDCFYNIENFLSDVINEKIMSIQDLMSLKIENIDSIDEWIDLFCFNELNCGAGYFLINDKIYKVII